MKLVQQESKIYPRNKSNSHVQNAWELNSTNHNISVQVMTRDYLACTHAPNSTLTCRRRFGLFIANTLLHARRWVTQILYKHCSTLCAQHHRPCIAHVIQAATQLSLSTQMLRAQKAEGPKRLDSNSVFSLLFFFFSFSRCLF